MITETNRQNDADEVVRLLQEDAALLQEINSGTGRSRTLIDEERDKNERKRRFIAERYETGYLGIELKAVILGEEIPTNYME